MIRTILWVFILGSATEGLFAQSTWPEPFSEANKAIAFVENKPKIFDSLKMVYKNRWSLGIEYGQRLLSNDNISSHPDTITFTDFTNKRSFFGIEAGYFITSRLQVFLAFDVLFLPKKKNIDSISYGNNGISATGSGSGGAMINVGIGSKFYFPMKPFVRPYVGAKMGRINAVAEGGKGGFNSGQNQFRETSRLTKDYTYGNLTLGLTNRITPGFMLDLNMGYLFATKSENIGGVLSPGGFTSTLTMQFIIGKGNKGR